MIDPINSLNATEFAVSAKSSFIDGLSKLIAPFSGIVKAVGIAFLIYFIFLIIKSIVNIRNTFRMKKLVKNVEEINDKLGKIVGSDEFQDKKNANNKNIKKKR